MSVALTNACDLHCSFCYAPKFAARLDSQDVIKWATELDRGGCLGIGFGGGEPTLHPDFVTLCQRVAADTQLAVTFTTHGHRLTDAIVSRLTGAVHFMRISMDGVGETYTRIRNRPFSTLIEKLTLAQRISPFAINYVVNAHTIDDLDSAAKVAFDAGASEMLLLPERSVAGKGGTDEATRQTLFEWVSRRSDLRLAISTADPLEGIPLADPFPDDTDELEAYAHIDASRQLKASSFSPHGVPILTTVESALDELRK